MTASPAGIELTAAAIIERSAGLIWSAVSSSATRSTSAAASSAIASSSA